MEDIPALQEGGFLLTGGGCCPDGALKHEVCFSTGHEGLSPVLPLHPYPCLPMKKGSSNFIREISGKLKSSIYLFTEIHLVNFATTLPWLTLKNRVKAPASRVKVIAFKCAHF